MPPLRVRLLVTNPDRDDVVSLATALRLAGHVVMLDGAGPTLPEPPGAPDFVISEGTAFPVPESLEAAEARHIATVLVHTGGNRRQAALLLRVARSTLLAKIRKYQL